MKHQEKRNNQQGLSFRRPENRASLLGMVIKDKERLPAERYNEEEQKPENSAELTLITVLVFDDCCVSVIFAKNTGAVENK